MSLKKEFRRERRRMMNACACAIANRQPNPAIPGPGAFQFSSPVISPAATSAALQAAVAARGAAQAQAPAAAAGAVVGPVVGPAQASRWTWLAHASNGAGGCTYNARNGTVSCYGQEYPAQLMQYGGTPQSPMAYVSAQILGGARWVPVVT